MRLREASAFRQPSQQPGCRPTLGLGVWSVKASDLEIVRGLAPVQLRDIMGVVSALRRPSGAQKLSRSGNPGVGALAGLREVAGTPHGRFLWTLYPGIRL